MTTITLPNKWAPRHYQRKLWTYLERGGRHAEVIWCRRAGKDDVALHFTATAAMQRPGGYWHCLPSYAQCRKAIWDAVNPHTGRKRIDEAFPEAIRRRTNSSTMLIEFVNGSIWQLVGSDNFNALVGSPPVQVVFSEWALSNPAARAYLQPILAENNGRQIYITTPRGKNHAYTTFMNAKADMEAGFDVFAQMVTAEQTGQYTAEQLAKIMGGYIRDYGEVVGKTLFEQEFLCSFSTPVLGAIYAAEMRAAEAEGRVCDVPYVPAHGPVIIVFDLGRRDKTAVWFIQKHGGRKNVIDYYECTGKHIGEVMIDLQRKNYVYGDCLLPHDANNELLASKLTVAQQMRQAGFKVKTVPKTGIDTRIQATRLTLPSMHFDARRTEKGVEAMKAYKYAVDDEHHYSLQPAHDENSHAPDSLGYFCVADREPTPQQAVKTRSTPRMHTARGSWMGN